ncbi:hypothetical protein CMUS01_12459 [Colletotrichum musicola]|uniref:Uncharacterized protein n=1 Tax=Colletotrichum musicola TaxID=2175873 RepID=A0A8H6JMJ2_9PEZI|nr:hypothetical protein CMUS01_12459 [Colletotrichum musicola]
MTDALLRRQEPEGSNCHQDCANAPKELLANPDVGGIGVLVGFVATGWLVVFLVIFRYCLAFDPTADPLANPKRDRKDRVRRAFKPNAVDVKTTNMFSGLRRRLGHHSHWNMAFTKVLRRLPPRPKTSLNVDR